jgi:cysteinyl-tRNA synthetase
MILIRNSLTGELEDISHKKQINFYVCGPTTYSHSHLGHARNYIVHDTIRRILEDYFNIPVQYVMNITDIDDKIVKASKDTYGDENLENCKRISDYFEEEFFDLMGKLGVKRPTHLTRVTDYIPEMTEYVQQIVSNGYAYECDGSYWFNSKQFCEDGFTNNPFNLKQIDLVNESANENSNECQDFCLLKHKNDSEPHFSSCLGNFRPGWHLECSAMATKVLGHVDIHGGGFDLMFPHHTNEILQACAYSKTNNWCDVFYHCGHLAIKGQKMAKSEKNFTTIQEILDVLPPQQLRLYFLKYNHNKCLDFSKDELYGLSTMYTKLVTFVSLVKKFNKNTRQTKISTEDKILTDSLVETKIKIDQYLRHNFNTQDTILSIDYLIDLTNALSDKVNKNIIFEVHSYIMRILSVLGIMFDSNNSEKCDEMLHYLIDLRNDVRELALSKTIEKDTKKKLFDITDKFRNVIFPNLGVIITDK